MALVNFSPLVSGVSGKTANIVFARWKGRAYIRERVIPANPQTVDQVTQRNFMSKSVGWWHDLKATLKDACDELGATWSVSGFNAFTARNLKDLADVVDERLMPLNSPENPVASLTAVTGVGASGDIDLTWVKGEADGLKLAYVAYEKTGTPAGQSAIAIKADVAIVNSGSYTLTGLDPATEYNVWLMVHRAAAPPITEMFSIACKDTATSKA